MPTVGAAYRYLYVRVDTHSGIQIDISSDIIETCVIWVRFTQSLASYHGKLRSEVK